MQGPRGFEQEYWEMRQELSALQNKRAAAVNHAQAVAASPLADSDADGNRATRDLDRDEAHHSAGHFCDRHEHGIGTAFHRARTS
jgi:hypothetical protein